MNKNSIFAKPIFLFVLSFIAAILAIVIIYVCLTDDFLHSFVFIFLYLYLFLSIFMVGTAFKKGQKEIVKMASTTLLTICLVFHTFAFIDIINLNRFYFFTGNIFSTLVGINSIILFVLFYISFNYHFIINKTNESNTKKVKTNTLYLVIVAFLSIAQAIFIGINDHTSGKSIEVYLILSYIVFFLISFIIICIETLINVFRIAREEGNLEKVATNLVGKKAAKAAESIDIKEQKPIKNTNPKINTTTNSTKTTRSNKSTKTSIKPTTNSNIKKVKKLKQLLKETPISVHF